MSPEELKGMNGRRVLIEATILNCKPDGGGHICVVHTRSDGSRLKQYVPASAIKEILPEPIKVGDRVKSVQGLWSDAWVLAIHKGRAWVLYGNGKRDDWPLSDLTLVEPGQ